MAKRVAVCGTNSGYQGHRVRKEDPCAECREAHRVYVREYRSRPVTRALSNMYSTAAHRAYMELSRRYPQEYRELYQQSMKDLKQAVQNSEEER